MQIFASLIPKVVFYLSRARNVVWTALPDRWVGNPPMSSGIKLSSLQNVKRIEPSEFDEVGGRNPIASPAMSGFQGFSIGSLLSKKEKPEFNEQLIAGLSSIDSPWCRSARLPDTLAEKDSVLSLNQEVVLLTSDQHQMILSVESVLSLGPNFQRVAESPRSMCYSVPLPAQTIEHLIALNFYHEIPTIASDEFLELILLCDQLRIEMNDVNMISALADVYASEQLLGLAFSLNKNALGEFAQQLLTRLVKREGLDESLVSLFQDLLSDNDQNEFELQPNEHSSERVTTLFLMCLNLRRKVLRLNLSGLPLNSEHIQIIARSFSMSFLESLDLRGTGVGDYACKALCRQQVFGQLGSLNLADCMITDAGVEALVSSYGLMALERLDCSHNLITDRGCELLLSAPTVSSLSFLNLGYNAIEAEGVAHIVQTRQAATLQTLILNGNRLGDKGAVELVQRSWDSLITLGLEDCSIGEEGLQAIRRSNNLSRLRDFNIAYNPLTETDVTQFLASENFPYLKNLQLGSSNQPLAWTACAAATWRLPKLDCLTLITRDIREALSDADIEQLNNRARVWLSWFPESESAYALSLTSSDSEEAE